MAQKPIEKYAGFISHERSKLVEAYRKKDGKMVIVRYLYNLHTCLDCKCDLWVLAQNKVSTRCNRCQGIYVKTKRRKKCQE